jgi:hypothetical protein
VKALSTLTTLASLLLAVGLAACGEKPQAVTGKKTGPAAYTGTGNGYQAGGWKAGDATSWNEQMRTRAQYGQNDYSRTAGK